MRNLFEYDHITCNSELELVECARFLIKSGQDVINFDGTKFTKHEDYSVWVGGFCFDHEDKYWGRFYIKNSARMQGNNIEFKYLARKDKIKQLNEIHSKNKL